MTEDPRPIETTAQPAPSSNGHAHSAQVVVLTATVQVLMVGSRQITQSVFHQLDIVPWPEMVPMGRVRSKDGRPWGVGSCRGVLVRAFIDHRQDDRGAFSTELHQWMALPLIVLAGLR